MRTIVDDSLLSVLAESVHTFRRLRIPYVLIGAWGVAVWGRPRATLDFDFLVGVTALGLERLGERMVQFRMELDEAWRDWNPVLRGSQLRLQLHGVTIDLLRPRDPHDRESLRRRRKKRLGARYYWFAAPEDMILQKLKVGRPRDFEDALTILARSGVGLDWRYLARWGKRLGVWDEIEYLRTIPDEP